MTVKKNNNEQLSKYAEKKLYFRQKNRYYHEYISKMLRFFIPEGSSVVEIGCAAGHTLAALDPDPGYGIDKNEFLVEKGKKIFPELKFIKCDVESENPAGLIGNQKFDYIIASDLIGTLNDIQSVFEKMKVLSHDRTKIIVTYYNYFWSPILKLMEFLGLKMPEGEKNWLYIDEIKNLLSLSDFHSVKDGAFLLLPAGIPLLSSLLNKYIAHLPLIKRLCLVGYVVANYVPYLAEKKMQTKTDYSVSILIPCKNEEGNIEEIVDRLPGLGKHTEIIFVEGNSEDNTYEKIKEVISSNPDKDIKLFLQENRGKADAVRKGFENADGEILMILDADMTVAPEELTKFYEALKNGKGELINGTRLVYQMDSKAMRPLNKIGNIFFSRMFTYLLGQRITDTLCGTKVLFRSDYLKIMKNRNYFGNFDPFGDFDLLFGAAKLNLKIIEIPVRYGKRKYGKTNINRFRDGLLLLKMCSVAMKKIKFI